MYARHPDVIIRREYFGGIAFHRGTGAAIELDREACLFLEHADGSSIRALADGICEEGCVSIQDIYAVADTLLREGFLTKDAKNAAIKATGWPKRYAVCHERVCSLRHRSSYGLGCMAWTE